MGKNRKIIFLKQICFITLIVISVLSLLVGAYFTFKLEHNISEFEDSLKIDYVYDTADVVKKVITDEVKQINRAEYEMNFRNYCESSAGLDHIPLIFPQTINSEKCDFLCYTQQIYGAVFYYRVQLYLKNEFIDTDAYLEEINRLESIQVNKNDDKKPVYFEDLFLFPSYVTIYNYYSVFEYAVCDYDNKAIYYVFLYDVGLRNMKIPSFLIPYKLLKDTSYESDKKYINVYNDVYFH